MWNLIIGSREISSTPKVREILNASHDFDFERIYNEVMSGTEYSDEDRRRLARAVDRAYEHVDEIVRNWRSNLGSPNALCGYGFRRFIASFAAPRPGDETGLVFTLNQDLLVERHHHDLTAVLWGLRRGADLRAGGTSPLEESDYITLPTVAPDLDRERSPYGLAYVKLHGSWNWRSSDGERRMVIGRAKSQQIANEPLLDAYLELFGAHARSGERQLLIAGYGFGDAHINGAIADGVEKGDLHVFIMSPQDQGRGAAAPQLDTWSSYLSRLEGYFPYTLRQLFPENQDRTPAWEHVRRGFFENSW